MAYSLIRQITYKAGLLYTTVGINNVRVDVYSQENNAANTSDIKVQVLVKVSSASYDYSIPCFMFIDGTDYEDTKNFTGNSTWKVLYEKIKTGIAHNADGTKHVAISAFIDTGMNSTVGDIRLEATNIYFPTIPRKSILTTMSPFNIEDTINVPLTKYAAEFYHVLTLAYETFIKTINGYENNDDIDLTIDELLELYALIADREASFVITLHTYTTSGGSLVGSVENSVTGIAAGTAYIKESGQYKRMLPSVKVSGVYKKAVAYIKVSGAYKRGIG